MRDPLLRILAASCAIALLARLAAFALMPGALFPDEDFQYLEQAHRIVFGSGLVPWEYVIGIRSWILPGFLSPAFEAGRLLGGDPRFALWIVATGLSVLSLPVVVCAVLWGHRAGGLAAAAAAGAATATWFEIAGFAPHALADTIATSALIPGLYLSGVGRTLPSARLRLGGCLLLGCALIVRFQLAPVVLLAGLWCAWRGGWREAVLGLVIPVLISGAVDATTLSYPFQSFLKNMWVNVFLGGAEAYGSLPWYGYLVIKLIVWGVSALPIVVLACVGTARLPVVAVFAASVALPFVAIAHKEDRFIYPVLPLLFTLASIGSAMAAQALANRIGLHRRTWIAGAGCALAWPGLSLWTVSHVGFWRDMYQSSTINAAVSTINRDAAACGVAMHPEEPWARTPGTARFWPQVKIYGFTDGDPVSHTNAFDYVIDSSSGGELGKAGFSMEACWDAAAPRSAQNERKAHVCLWHRPGGCDRSAAPTLRPPIPAFLAGRHLEMRR